MGTDNPEIAKLKERIAKDPKSKLFVSLAEEYRKGGGLDAAIRVLQDGLKHSPTYVTARSFLGRYLMEKGDLAAALKEFQTVATSIPDNLLAQRKLGDLLVLMDKEQEALERYRAVIKLTPRDVEVSGLIAEIEAGRSVKPRIAQMQPARPASAAPAGKAFSPGKTQGPETAGQRPAAANAPAARGPASIAEEMAEDIVAVEMLAPAAAPGAPFVPDVSIDLPSETEGLAGEVLELVPDVPLETGGDALPELLIPDADMLAPDEEMLPVSEEPAGEEAALQAPAPAAPLRKADDFTTDTLAELYIAQGFYEKAIDIYDRMLRDNPGHQGLIDKLARIRSLAGGTPDPGSAGTDSTPDPLLTPVPDAGRDRQGDDEAAAAIFGQEEAPGAIDEAAASFDVPFEPAAEVQATGSFFGAGEPEAREYIPPAPSFDDREPSVPSGGFDLSEQDENTDDPRGGDDVFADFVPAAPGRTGTSAPFASGGGRAAVIGRLEQWLRNITKER